MSGGIRPIKYLFIDGAYFRYVVKDISSRYFHDIEIPIDFKALSSDFNKTFYYDCLEPKNSEESNDDYDVRVNKQKEFFNSLRLLEGYHVFEGITYGTGKRIRQKKIDVAITVDMLTHSYRKNMQQATLLTGDLDFKPLIDALVQDGMWVTLWYEKATTNPELIYAADSSGDLNIQNIYDNWAKSEFKLKHKMPIAIIKEKDVTGFNLICKGKTNIEVDIELYKASDSFRIIFPWEEGQSYYHCTFENRDILERFVKDTQIDFTWERKDLSL